MVDFADAALACGYAAACSRDGLDGFDRAFRESLDGGAGAAMIHVASTKVHWRNLAVPPFRPTK
jgi:hypothetical protein